MGKASSSKKVAKAAKAGGNPRTSEGRKWGFPAAVAAIVVAGLALIVFVRFGATSEADVEPRLGVDHWHSAYGIWLCDEWGPALADTQGDQAGIHTHEDPPGVIHIHPTSGNAAGENAQLGVFFDEVGFEVSDDSFTLPDGRTFTNGDDCNGEEGIVQVAKWSSGDFEGDPEIFTSELNTIRFLGNGEAYVVAFAPEGTEFELPPSLGGINEVTDVAPGELDPVEVPEGLESPTGAPSGDGTVPTTAAGGG